MRKSMTVALDMSLVSSGYSGCLHQYKWPPRYTEILLKVALNTTTLAPDSCTEMVAVAPCHGYVSWKIAVDIEARVNDLNHPAIIELTTCKQANISSDTNLWITWINYVNYIHVDVQYIWILLVLLLQYYNVFKL